MYTNFTLLTNSEIIFGDPPPPMKSALGMIMSSVLQFNKSLNLACCYIENAQLESGTFDLRKFSHATRPKCTTEKKHF